MLQMLVSLVAGSPCGDIVFSGNLFVKSTAVPVAGTSYTALHLPQLCVWGRAELQSFSYPLPNRLSGGITACMKPY